MKYRPPNSKQGHRVKYAGKKRHPALPPGPGWYLCRHRSRGTWRAGRFYDDGMKIQREFKSEAAAIGFIRELQVMEKTAFDVCGFLSRAWGAATQHNAGVPIYEFER
ncbi:hypothetical protein [Primorskyibacter sedentarius]|uniref:hypothetical protein n=1 Tax=Primorskyibacter sedentarius TaxID=745311 RepID=UPI003EC07DD9